MSRTKNKFKLFQAVFALALAALSITGTFAWAGEQPKLVLQITVDGLRADLLERYRGGFVEGEFNRLLETGTVYTNAHYLHANTETIVGHATLATGTFPSLHGMVGNVWFDRDAAELAYNIEDPDYTMLTGGAGVDAAGHPTEDGQRDRRGQGDAAVEDLSGRAHAGLGAEPGGEGILRHQSADQARQHQAEHHRRNNRDNQ